MYLTRAFEQSNERYSDPFIEPPMAGVAHQDYIIPGSALPLHSSAVEPSTCPAEASAGSYLALNNEPCSDAAIALANAIAAQLWAHAPRKRPQPTRKFQQTVGALCADLIKIAAAGPSSYGYRPMKAGSFSHGPVGYKALKAVADAMSHCGWLIMVVPPYRPSPANWAARIATTFQPSTGLLSLAERHGVHPAGWSSHYRPRDRPAVIPNPIVRRAASKGFGKRKKAGGEMPVDRNDDRVNAFWAQVEQINAFWAKQKLEGGTHLAFQRIFNDGDSADFKWNKGGRLYSIGRDSYQQLSQEARRHLRINGEPVIEIDIRASFLTIYLALMGDESVRPGQDPYSVPDRPRHVVKSWVNMTFGYDRFHSRWNRTSREDHAIVSNIELQRQYPIRQTREIILNHIPALRLWPGGIYRWGDLQFLESCAIISTVHQLAHNYGIAALPVHDSIILPSSAQNVGKETLSFMFHRQIGVVPTLAIK